MSSRVLVLTNAYQPHRIISWERALTLVFGEKAEVLEEYDEDISSVSLTVKMPSVIRLVRAVRGNKRVVKFSRVNILIRDGFRCQYCGTKFPDQAFSKLNYDHVVPKSRGGGTNWENIVASCYSCNARKGNKTLEQAGMRLLKKPERPKFLPVTMLRFDKSDVHDTWATYLFWKGELDQDA